MKQRKKGEILDGVPQPRRIISYRDKPKRKKNREISKPEEIAADKMKTIPKMDFFQRNNHNKNNPRESSIPRNGEYVSSEIHKHIKSLTEGRKSGEITDLFYIHISLTSNESAKFYREIRDPRPISQRSERGIGGIGVEMKGKVMRHPNSGLKGIRKSELN